MDIKDVLSRRNQGIRGLRIIITISVLYYFILFIIPFDISPYILCIMKQMMILWVVEGVFKDHLCRLEPDRSSGKGSVGNEMDRSKVEDSAVKIMPIFLTRSVG